ncbi:hypothetical protein [Halobacillus sp. BAB-2008]|uniref:hypothetical protein n=1 Tax=Halobacillus sp. BAB-2008 TaxID=1246484 RepID=UPI0002A4D292|nr:hypothetical protein [Halobacillus sp. BAB-2008]ELK47845.1 hypothetical protein D479_05125 [Halobacillus sp. BAB-2008]
MRKSFQLLGMAVVLLVFGFSLPITSFAAGTGGQSGSIDLANLNDNENVTIEKLTYDEMIEEIAANEGISVEKAKAQHPDKSNELQNAASKRATTEGSSCGAVDPHRIGVSLDVSSTPLCLDMR